MKKMIVLTLIFVLCISFCACSNQLSPVGMWKSTSLDFPQTYEFMPNGTVIFECEAYSCRGEWKTTKTGIEITIPYQGTDYIVQGEWLIIGYGDHITYHNFASDGIPDNIDEMLASGEYMKSLQLRDVPYPTKAGMMFMGSAIFQGNDYEIYLDSLKRTIND